MKAIAILRVSTTSQTIDEQKEELIGFLKGQGYDEIIPIEAVGASAIKMDDKYLELVQRVKDTILADSEIKAAGVWELSRLGRNEITLFEFKEFFVSHKIQFICKNPYMKLLDEDGSVNSGMELAFSLFATMSKQEMAEKKARFRRSKKSMAAKGKYIGGNTRPYGYAINEEGFFVEKPDESSNIKLAFELYSTGKYSTYSLSQELEERGIHIKDYFLCRMLRNRAYLGEPIGEYGVHYPPIISEEVFEKVRAIREKNLIDMKKKKVVLGAKLVKCYKCGATCTSNSRHYVCSRHSHHGNCDNGFALRQCVVDDILWRVGFILQIDYLTNLNSDKAQEYRKEIEVLKQKVTALEEKCEKSEKKKARIVGSYIDGLISLEERDRRLEKANQEVEEYLKKKAVIDNKVIALSNLLEDIDKDMDLVESLADAAVLEYSTQEKYAIIHRFIVQLTARQVSFGKRDPRTSRPNGVEIEITSVYGGVYKFMYVPKFLDGHNLYVWNGRRYVGDMVEITD